MGPIERLKRGLQTAIRRGAAFDPGNLFLIDGAYHLLYAVRAVCTQSDVDPHDADLAIEQLPSAMEVVKGAVKREETAAPAFAYRRFFKSKRAKRYIDEGAEALHGQRPLGLSQGTRSAPVKAL